MQIGRWTVEWDKELRGFSFVTTSTPQETERHIAEYRKVLESDPGNFKIRYLLGNCLLSPGTEFEAFAEWEKVIEQTPTACTANGLGKNWRSTAYVLKTWSSAASAPYLFRRVHTQSRIRLTTRQNSANMQPLVECNGGPRTRPLPLFSLRVLRAFEGVSEKEDPRTVARCPWKQSS